MESRSGGKLGQKKKRKRRETRLLDRGGLHDMASPVNSLASSSASVGGEGGLWPYCRCGIPAALKSAWTEQNAGRRFFGCRNYGVCVSLLCWWAGDFVWKLICFVFMV